ncbi:hypothetical protein PF008_g16719 [Phytophthora fragariae]|uniref:SCP domain-containing protein n=1 Tax=Phytophthora fragariae TaxID=53985 RepID=A0A6G0RAG8_9STRA|nr:hypothetical protein PF008_g16719 [Phytophthora fragariae]
MSLKLILTLAFSLVAASSPLEAHAKLRPTPRQLQTYTQSADYVGLMLERVNLERAVQGLPALCANSKLQASAQRHSDDQAANDFMDHVGSDGSTMSQRVSDAGYDWRGVAENVAAGQVDVTEVMDAWMNSEGHRHNILGDYTMLGAAYAYTPDGLYRHFWTQDFGRSDTEHCDDSAAGSTPASPSSNSSSSSSDNTISAPNRRDSRSSSSSILPPHVMVLFILTSTMLHLI